MKTFKTWLCALAVAVLFSHASVVRAGFSYVGGTATFTHTPGGVSPVDSMVLPIADVGGTGIYTHIDTPAAGVSSAAKGWILELTNPFLRVVEGVERSTAQPSRP